MGEFFHFIGEEMRNYISTFYNLWRPADLPCSNPTKVLIKNKDGGACTKADFAQIQGSFIKARLGRNYISVRTPASCAVST